MAELESGFVQDIVVWEVCCFCLELNWSRCQGLEATLCELSATADDACLTRFHVCNHPSLEDDQTLQQLLSQQFELIQTHRFVDWIADRHHMFGSTVHIVRQQQTESALVLQFCKGLGGVAFYHLLPPAAATE